MKILECNKDYNFFKNNKNYKLTVTVKYDILEKVLTVTGKIKVLTSIIKTTDVGYSYKQDFYVDYLSGCCHEEILEVEPKFQIFVDSHNKKPNKNLIRKLKTLIQCEKSRIAHLERINAHEV